MAIGDPAVDPFAVPPAWDGPWPPDPSWDAPIDPLAPPVEDAPPGEVPLGWDARRPSPVVPGEPVVTPASADGDTPPPQLDAIDPDLVELDDGGDPPGWQGWAATALAEQAPAVDAVSGGALPLEQTSDVTGLDAGVPTAAPPTEDDLRAQYAAMDPVQFAETRAKHQMAADAEAATARLAAAEQDRHQAELSQLIRRDAVAKAREEQDAISAEASRLAMERVDPDGWMQSRNLGQTIAAFATAIVGGLIQSRKGGANQGLAAINNAIERHIAVQKENLAMRRGAVDRRKVAADQSLVRADEDFRTEESFRQAMWQRTIEDIETERMNYDPAGTRALKLAEVSRGARAQLAAAQLAAAEKLEDREIKRGEFGLKVRAAEEAERARKQAAAAAAAARRLDRERFEYQKTKDAADRDLEREKIEGARQAKLDERALKVADDVRDLQPAGPRGPLTQKDGATPFLFPKGSADEGFAKMSSAAEVSSIIDEILKLRDEVGGEADVFNSDQKQQYQVLQAQVRKIAKAGTHGMSSDSDMALIAESVGAADVASFRARAAGLKEARERTATELNTYLRARKYDGDPIEFPSERKGAEKTPNQREFAKLVESTTGEKGQAVPTWAVLSPAGLVARATESAVRSEDSALADGDEKAQIDSWAKDAASPDATPERAETRKYLRDLSRSRSPAIRKYADAALKRIVEADVAAKEAAGVTGKRALDEVLVELKAELGE